MTKWTHALRRPGPNADRCTADVPVQLGHDMPPGLNVTHVGEAHPHDLDGIAARKLTMNTRRCGCDDPSPVVGVLSVPDAPYPASGPISMNRCTHCGHELVELGSRPPSDSPEPPRG